VKLLNLATWFVFVAVLGAALLSLPVWAFVLAAPLYAVATILSGFGLIDTLCSPGGSGARRGGPRGTRKAPRDITAPSGLISEDALCEGGGADGVEGSHMGSPLRLVPDNALRQPDQPSRPCEIHARPDPDCPFCRFMDEPIEIGPEFRSVTGIGQVVLPK